MSKITFILLLVLAFTKGNLLQAQTSVEFILTEDEKPIKGKENLEMFLLKDNKLTPLQLEDNYFKVDQFQDSAQICITLPEHKIMIPMYYSYNSFLDIKTLIVDIWSDSRRKKEKQYRGDKLIYSVTEDMRGDREGLSTIIEVKK